MNPSTTFRVVGFAAFLMAAGPTLALAQGGAATSKPTNTTGMPTTGSSPAMPTPGMQTAPEAPLQTTRSSEGGAMMQGMMGGEMPGHEMAEHRRGMMMMHHTSAAIFRMRRGDNSIFIKCAENESTQACVAAAGMLLDKLNSQPKP